MCQPSHRGLTLQRILSVLGVGLDELPALDRLAVDSDSREITLSHDGPGVVVGGIGDGALPSQVWRAGLESVTEDIAALHQTMTAVSGHHARMTGGWANSAALCHVTAARFGELLRPVVLRPAPAAPPSWPSSPPGTYGSARELPALEVRESAWP